MPRYIILATHRAHPAAAERRTLNRATNSSRAAGSPLKWLCRRDTAMRFSSSSDRLGSGSAAGAGAGAGAAAGGSLPAGAPPGAGLRFGGLTLHRAREE